MEAYVNIHLSWSLLAMATLLLISCDSSYTSAPNYDPLSIHKQKASDIDMVYSDSGRIEFRIQAGEWMQYEEERQPVEQYSRGFLLEFYDVKKNVIASLRAEQAERRAAEGLLVLRDSVQYQNTEGDFLMTNALTIDERNSTIHSGKFFKLIKRDTRDTLYGYGFRSDADFTHFEVDKYIQRGKRMGWPQ